jgi:hypothetical protein
MGASGRARSSSSAATRTVALALEQAVRRQEFEGRRVWLVKVSGLYLAPNRGLVGDPAAAKTHDTPEEAKAVRDEVRAKKLWLGRVYVVRRTHLRAPQW